MFLKFLQSLRFQLRGDTTSTVLNFMSQRLTPITCKNLHRPMTQLQNYSFSKVTPTVIQ